MNQLLRANNLTLNSTTFPATSSLGSDESSVGTASTTPELTLNSTTGHLPTSQSLYYERLSKGFGAATGILGIAGQACFGTGLGYYSTAALGTTLYLLTPLPWLGQKIPDSFIDAGRTGDRWMIAGAALTGAATLATILTITLGVKSRQPHAR